MRKLPWLVKPVKRITTTGIEIQKIRNSRQWRDRTRPNKLSRNAYCEKCDEKGILTEATEVDHIIPLEAGGEPYEDSNLQSLCKRCHGVKTGEENKERMKAKFK